MSDELKPCPFCGAPAELEQCDTEGPREFRWTVGCHDDECIGYQSLTTYDRQITAVAAWNRRAAAPEPPAPGVSDDGAKRLVLEGGKYELIVCADGSMVVNRYGEPWRSLSGDKFVYALAQAALQAPPAPITADARDGEPGVVGECIEVGDDEEGQPRILIHTTREALKAGPALCFRNVRVTVAAASLSGAGK